MSLKEGLESEDPIVIKRARGVAKGNVTRHTKNLTVLLKKDSEGEFVYDDIDEADVLELVNKVNESLEDTRNLHSRLQQFREVLENAVDNDKQLEEDQTYIDEVYGSCSDAALSLYGSYKKKAKEIEKIKQLNKEEKSAKKNLELAKAAAHKVIQVESMKATARSTREDLLKAFEDYTDKCVELEAAIEEGDESEKKYKSTCDYETEIDEVSDLGSKLKAIAISVEKNKSNISNPILISTFKEDPMTKPIEVKSDNHDTTKKFGASCPEIGDVIIQLKKMTQMKVVDTDEGFVEYVEKLEEIQKDLSALNIIGEIANKATIDKLESKLPTLTHIDWSKEVTEEELYKKTSMDKFQKLMDFLRKARKRIEYKTSDSNQQIGDNPALAESVGQDEVSQEEVGDCIGSG